MSFIDDFKAARAASGMSQADLARRMKERGFNWRQTTVSKVEAGRELTLSEAVALSGITGVPLPGAAPDGLAAALARVAELERRIARAASALVLEPEPTTLNPANGDPS